jgi:hypothetical protein
MKLAVTSDLHLPTTPAPAIAALGREVAAFAPDALVVAGDVAESAPEFERCLATLRGELTCPVWVLAGNHDLWHRSAPSRVLWEELLPAATRRADCRWLEGTSFVVDGVGVAGTLAWYDYSAIDPQFAAPLEVIRDQKGQYNMDAVLIDWPWSDQEFAGLIARPFLAELDRLEADPAVRQVVVVTHVPLLEAQMCRRPHDRAWGFSNAYFGHLTLGGEVVKRTKVTHIVSGHTHVGRDEQVRLGDGRVVAASVLDSQYGRPVWQALTLEPAAART